MSFRNGYPSLKITFLEVEEKTDKYPYFFSFCVFENSAWVNTPDIIITKQHLLNFDSLRVLKIQCSWDNFQYESICPFNQGTDVT